MKKKLLLILAILFTATSLFAMKLYLTNTSSAGQAQADPNASLGGYRSTTELSATSMKNLFDDVSIVEALLGDVEYRMVDIYNDGADPVYKAQFYMQAQTSSPGTVLSFGYSATNQPHADSWNGEALSNESTAPASPSMTFYDFTKTAPLALGTIPAGQSKRVCVKRTVTADAPWTAHDLGRFGLKWGGVAAAEEATNYLNDASCMAAWFMDDTGDELDDGGNGETGVETSGTIPTSATVPTGYSGTSRYFNSSDTENLTIADGGECDISGADQKISIVFWMQSETADYLNDGYIVQKWNYSTTQRQYTAYVSGENIILFKLSSNGTAAATATSDVNVTDGNYHHVACVYNDTDMRIYIDGDLDASATTNYSSGIYAGSAALMIGASCANDAPFDGLLDEVAIFNKALSAAEVLEIYTNGLSGDKGASD